MPPAKLSPPPVPSTPEMLVLEGSSLKTERKTEITLTNDLGRQRSPLRTSKMDKTPKSVLSPTVVPLPQDDDAILRRNIRDGVYPTLPLDLDISPMSTCDKGYRLDSKPHYTSPLSASPATITPPTERPQRLQLDTNSPLSISSIKLPSLSFIRDTSDIPGSPSFNSSQSIRPRSKSDAGSLHSWTIRSPSKTPNSMLLEGRKMSTNSRVGARSPLKVRPLGATQNIDKITHLQIDRSPLEVNGSTFPVYERSEGSVEEEDDYDNKLPRIPSPSKNVTFNVADNIELSEATKRLLFKSDTDDKIKCLSTVSLQKLAAMQPATFHTPRLPPLGRPRSQPNFWNQEDTIKAKSGGPSINISLFLGPDTAEEITNINREGQEMYQTDSFNLRKEYSKNLEKNWYHKMLNEEHQLQQKQKFKTLCKRHKLDKSLDEFYKSFYHSASDFEEGGSTEKEKAEKQTVSDGDIDCTEESEWNTPLIRFASTDVLVSDTDSDSESDIEVVLQDEDIVDKRIKYKMRKHRYRQELRYSKLIAPEQDIERRRAEFEDGTFHLCDTEIRALRLKLKKSVEDADPGFDEKCTIEEVMKALARLKGTKKKGTKRRKKKGTEPKGSRGYGQHMKESMYDRFLKEYGHLLDGYQPEPLSDDSESDTEEQLTSTGLLETNQSNGLPSVQYGKDGQYSTLGSIRLPSLNFRYSPMRTSNMLGNGTITPAHTVDGTESLLATAPGRKKKTRLQKLLNKLNEENLPLLQGADQSKCQYTKTPRTARRNSDPGVHMGKILVQQKILETEEDIVEAEREAAELKKKKKKGKKKRKGKSCSNTNDNGLGLETMVDKEPENEPENERDQSSLDQAADIDIEFKDKPIRRVKSCHFFKTGMDKEISLRELTHDYDFPAKDVKIQIAERRLQRQRLRKGRVNAKAMKEKLDDKNREERRKLIALAKAEYLKALEIARAESNRERNEFDEVSSEEEEENKALMRRRSSVSLKVRRRSNGLLCELYPKPDYKSLINNSPYVSAGIPSSKTTNKASRIVTQAEIEDEAEQVSDLLLEMKECRYIRWSNIQQRIIDHVNELEMAQYDYDYESKST